MSNIIPFYVCAFCFLKHTEVRKLIQGPNNVCICDKCIESCVELIKDSEQAKPETENIDVKNAFIEPRK